jgi:isoleucyl-tRNA synthetase
VVHHCVPASRPEISAPADLYLEGSDQHRGWFHSSLLTSVAMFDRAPYKAVLTHGFTIDDKGRKMSKSLGNVIVPQKVVGTLGADVLRLWVAATDYSNEMSLSDEILKRVTDSYRRIRNTHRFMLGNLYDFTPETDTVALAQMPEIDRFTLHRLQLLVEKARRAYDLYEYHTIFHALHNFCAVDLSALYLDILKDRLYTSPAKSLERRSAQTVLYSLVDALCRLMAPILPFTAEEIWQHLPAVPGRVPSVHLSQLPAPQTEQMDAQLAERWEQLLAVRSEVTKALETARAQKRIGHALDAAVTLSVDSECYAWLERYAADLRSIFIVSAVELVQNTPIEGAFESTEIKELKIRVQPAAGEKCHRCWVHETSVGQKPEHPTICARCANALTP